MDEKETTIFTALIIGGVIIGIIIIYFFVSLMRHHRRNQQLYRSKIQAEITTLEKERGRMAADLHDELGPLLSSVKLKMNCLDIESEEDQVQLGKINQHIDDIMNRMREISNDLLPTTLQRKGLIPAIEESIAKLKTKNGLVISFESSVLPEIKQEKTIHIYRIVQEIIHNTIKHAKASELNIKINTKNDKIVLETGDNGIGFDQSDVAGKKSGLGLRNLLSRTEIMSGEMFLETKPGKGLRYIFEIPI